MALSEPLRQKLLLYKGKNNLSNKKLGEMLGCTGQSIGNWLVKKDSYISDDYVEKIKELTKDLKESSGISNSPELRQMIFRNCMQLRLNYDDLSEKIGQEISSKELKLLLSEDGAAFTAKTLSLICAAIDLNKEELPISQEEANQLYIGTIRKSLYYNTANLYSQSKGTKKAISKNFYIGDFMGDNLIAIKISDHHLMYRGILKNDIIVCIPTSWDYIKNNIDNDSFDLYALTTSKSNFIIGSIRKFSSKLKIALSNTVCDNHLDTSHNFIPVNELNVDETVNLECFLHSIEEELEVYKVIGLVRRKYTEDL